VTEEAAGVAVDDHRVRLGHPLKPRREVGCLPDHFVFMGWVIGDEIADHHETGGNAEPHLQRRPRSSAELLSRPHQCQPGADSALGIVLVRLRVAEIGKHAIAHVSSDETPMLDDHLGAMPMIGTDDVPKILRIKPRRECRRSDEVAEHHRELATLGDILWSWVGHASGSRPRRRNATTSGDGSQHLATIAEHNTKVLQILVCQISEDREINAVFDKTLSVFNHPKRCQPLRDCEHDSPFGVLRHADNRGIDTMKQQVER
jgi:hypothetical protein